MLYRIIRATNGDWVTQRKPVNVWERVPYIAPTRLAHQQLALASNSINNLSPWRMVQGRGGRTWQAEVR